ncbi:MAG: ComEC/Rec2 family competence protein, partial [Lachnospiraceae bacterium]
MIKRPLVPALGFMAAGILLRLYGVSPAAAMLVFAALSLCAHIGWRHSRRFKFFFIQILVFSILFLSGYITTYIHDSYDNSIVGEPEGVIIGQVEKISEGNYSVRIYLRKCSFNGKRLANKIIIEVDAKDWKYGDWKCKRSDIICVEGVLGSAPAPTNLGQFDTALYYKSLGYCYYVKSAGVVSIQQGHNFLIIALENIKSGLKSVYQVCCLKEDAGVYEAMVLGDKSDMDKTISDLFSAGGIGHILAISGLHISIIGMGLYKLLRKSGAQYPAAAAVSGGLVVLYGVMTGNPVSALRAIIMFVCAVYAQVIGRTYDILSAVSLSAILILIGNPYMVFNVGFLMSFLAVAGIAAVSGGFANKKFRVLTGSLSIQLATLPVILWFYFETPVYSVFLNLLVIPLMTFIMISALLTGATGCFYVAAGSFCAGTGHFILLVFQYACRLMLSLPHSSYVAGRPEPWQVVVYYVLLIVFSCRRQIGAAIHQLGNRCVKVQSEKYIVERIVSHLWTLLLIPALFILLVRPKTYLEINFLDVGQGDAIYISIPGGGDVFIDGGSTSQDKVYEQVIEPFLKYKGVRKLDFLFITHCDEDHYSGWSEAVESHIATAESGIWNYTGTSLYLPTIDNLILNGNDYEKYIQNEIKGENEKGNAGEMGKTDEANGIVQLAAGMAAWGSRVSADGLGTVYRFGECSFTSLNKSHKVYGDASENDNSIVLL